MELLLFILLILIVTILPAIISIGLGPPNKDNNFTLNGVPPCPPHKWKYREFMKPWGEKVWSVICDKCKKKAGEL